jgi:hypothetical protein
VPGDPTQDPGRSWIFALIGIGVVLVAIVIGILVFSQRPASPSCTSTSGGISGAVASPDSSQPSCP